MHIKIYIKLQYNILHAHEIWLCTHVFCMIPNTMGVHVLFLQVASECYNGINGFGMWI